MSGFAELQERAFADYCRPGTVRKPALPAAKPPEPARAEEAISPVRAEAPAPETSAMPVVQPDSRLSAEPTPASAADSAHVPPPPEIKLSTAGSARTADDEAGRKAHEEAEAKRRAEWEEKQAARQHGRSSLSGSPP